MSDLPPPPENAKQILPFILRSQEMSTRDPAISYWCKMHAAQLSLQYANDLPNLRPWLFNLMDHLEIERKRLGGSNEFISNPTVAFAHVENFALKIFAAADREDRAGHANLRTAKTFLAASNYLDVLGSILMDDEIGSSSDTDLKEKSVYAKWKATQIVKSIKSNSAQPQPTADDFKSKSQPDPICGSQPSSLGFTLSIPSSLTHVSSPLPLSKDSSDITHSSASTISSSSPTFPPYSSPRPPTLNTAPPKPINKTLPDPRVLAQAQKLAKFAVSALEYEDVSTAIDNLSEALKIIAPLDSRRT